MSCALGNSKVHHLEIFPKQKKELGLYKYQKRSLFGHTLQEVCHQNCVWCASCLTSASLIAKK